MNQHREISRSEKLVYGFSCEQLLSEFVYRNDIRSEPNNYRRAQFKAGWEDATLRVKVYTASVLKRLTWCNLGYRLGKRFGRKIENEIYEIYDIFAIFYKKSINSNESLNALDLRKNSQQKHTSELLDYLHVRLGEFIPEPAYEESSELSEFIIPEEIFDNENLYEGSKQRVIVNAYERNPQARKACISHYGTRCQICGFDFAQKYGIVGRGLIHVHHLKPLCDIGEEYKVDPIRDLCPVCPNCHTIIHRRNPPYTIEEVREFLRHASG